MEQKIVTHREKISKWYQSNQRNLPWRRTSDPYLIWVSEIILQQTQVKTGLSYYERFVKAFPDVKSLAEAAESEILKLWQGLGYYSRARNMHAAAKQVMLEHQGVFPVDYKGLISLKGVGEYTASAILSIAYNLPYAVVDGNVIRVISRLYGISEPVDTSDTMKKIVHISQLLLDRNNPGDFNQAVMEFGALNCVPQSPDCGACILNETCNAYMSDTVKLIPKKVKKVKVRTRHFNYLVIKEEDACYMQKRVPGDIWQGLFEYPLIESKTKVSEEMLRKLVSKYLNCDHEEIKSVTKLWGPRKHILTHQIIQASFYAVNIDKNLILDGSWLKVSDKEKANYPVARITELFWENTGNQEKKKR